jgi:small redox-active disulfide protein 2
VALAPKRAAAPFFKGLSMKVVKVFGTGCAKCEATAKLIEEVARTKDAEIRIEKVTALPEIVAMGVMSTPGVAIDGKVVHSGGIPDRDKIEGWL